MTSAVEYWRWKEYNWRSPDVDPRQAQVLSAGVDVGSVSSQAVVMADGELYAFANMRTGSNSPESAEKAMSWAGLIPRQKSRIFIPEKSLTAVE